MRARLYRFAFKRYRKAPFESRRATFWWKLSCGIEKRPIGRILCWFNWHKHPPTYAPAYWECARPHCDVVQRQKWW